MDPGQLPRLRLRLASGMTTSFSSSGIPFCRKAAASKGSSSRTSDFHDSSRAIGRQARAGPLIKNFYEWLESQGVFPKSPIGKAIQYVLNQKEALSRYIDIGYMGVDNNKAERAMRPIAMGRKNYLFAGSHRAAKNAAVLYSLIETCKMNNINITEYFQDVLERLPTTLNADIRTLLPRNWKPRNADLNSDLSLESRAA